MPLGISSFCDGFYYLVNNSPSVLFYNPLSPSKWCSRLVGWQAGCWTKLIHSILGRYGIKKNKIKKKIAHLQHFVHLCSRVEKLMNGCWKHILTSFRLDTVVWTVKSCVELKTAGWCDLPLCSKFNCYLDLGSEENVSVPSRLNCRHDCLFAFFVFLCRQAIVSFQ